MLKLGPHSNYIRLLIDLLVFAVVGLLLYLVFKAGHTLEATRGIDSFNIRGDSIKTFDLSHAINVKHTLSILILQILIIVIFSRSLAWVMSLIGQPTVIGEILAGIMLGPSLLGLLFPGVSAFLFPIESLSNLHFLSQIGLILFMFIIGMELDIGIVKQRANSALFISNASIIVPYIMGVCLAYFLYLKFTPQGAGFISFALFMGIAMSITAFPVLARIVQERGMTRTPLGMTVITSAAINDITAWGILAVVVAIANATAIAGALTSILLSLLYIVFMLMVVRPLLEKIASQYTVRETISKTVVAAVFCVILLSSFITESIGIHALFGAFMAGVIMPQNVKFKSIMAEKIEDVSLVLLLPLFFVYTGLRTDIGLLNDSSLWGVALLVILVAVTGKFMGSALAARIVGQSWKDSLMIGALMNTRGLIELVALNIGYDIGILSTEIFTILVLMALVTTFMTGPALTFINYLFRGKEVHTSVEGVLKVLISFGPSDSGARLLTLISDLFSKEKNQLKITALHLTPHTEISGDSAMAFEELAFSKIKGIALSREIDLKTEYRTAEAVSQEITRTANRGKFDFLVVGSSRPLIGSDKTGGKAQYFFDKVKSDVVLVIDKGFNQLNKVLMIYQDESSGTYLNSLTRLFDKSIETDVEFLDGKTTIDHNLEEYDLIITGLGCYRSQQRSGASWTYGPASILILSQR